MDLVDTAERDIALLRLNVVVKLLALDDGLALLT